VLVFTAALSLLTGLAFGLVPALHASSPALAGALNEGGRAATEGLRRNRARSLLVIAEVALALVLLIGAGLMVRSFRRLQQVDAGFEPRQLLSFKVSAPDEQARDRFYDELLGRVRALPGVTSASAINHLPIEGDVWAYSYVVGGQPAPRAGEEPTAIYRAMRPGYLATMRIPLLRGRDFSESDRPGTPPVVIVNQALARAAFAGREPLGQRLQIQEAWHEVVGVVKDAKQKDWTAAPVPELYLAERQSPARGYLTIVVRAAAGGGELGERLQREIRAMDGSLPVPRIISMEQAIAGTLAQPRFNLLLLNLFAALALVLAAVGLYGVMSYTVARRTREIGIRVALGAGRAQVLKLVVGQGMLMAGIGVVLGIAGALAITRLMASLLFGVATTDPVTFALVPLMLLGVGFLACYLPARRATRLDPMAALRHD
jgi:putative ABC transport system permease protein